MRNEFKRKAYLHGYEPILIAELEQEREWTPIHALEMPVVAIAGAALGAVAGVGLIGTSVVGTIIGGAMIVGSALTIVGTVTGNEDLTKIGGAISLVSGVAGFAAGAMGALGQNASGGNFTISDAFSNGMDKISNAWDSLSGGTTVNSASESLTSVVRDTNADAGNVFATVDEGVTDLNALNSTDYPMLTEYNTGGTNNTGTFMTGSVNPMPTDMNSNGLVNQALTTQPGTTVTPPSGTAAPAAPPATTPPAEKGIFSSETMGHAISGAAQGMGNQKAAETTAEAKEEQLKKEAKYASNGALIIDPNSPNKAELEAMAQSQGRPVVYMGSNPNAQPIKMPTAAGTITQTTQTVANAYKPPSAMQPTAPAPAKAVAPQPTGILKKYS